MTHPAPMPPPPPGPSFLRRHPVLAGFGVLAALSLFAAYWPISAIVTAVVVAGRASGLDLVAYDTARRGLLAVVRRIAHGRSKEPASPAPEVPGGPALPPTPEPPSVSAPGPTPPSPVTPAPSPSTPQPAPPEPPVASPPSPPRVRRQRAPVARGPAAKTPSGAGLEL